MQPQAHFSVSVAIIRHSLGKVNVWAPYCFIQTLQCCLKMQSTDKVIAVLSLLCLTQTSGQTTDCKPGVNCFAPNCRCWNDMTVPGGLSISEAPQIILVTFENAVNTANVQQYLELFQGITNPNSCPGVGSFYVRETDTDFSIVRQLFDNGHEIGVTTIDGTLPQTDLQWRNSLTEVRSKVVGTGIPLTDVIGVRAPELTPGGLNQWLALATANFLYDASCSTSTFDDQSSFLWPYTYNFAPGPSCDSGSGPPAAFPGKWQVLVADLEFNGAKCATPAACTTVFTQRDAFDLFYNSFVKHYQGGRSPFMIVINPEWASVDFKREGTRQFLEYVRAAFEDTWILSVKHALDWVRNPVPNANATTSYAPWSC